MEQSRNEKLIMLCITLCFVLSFVLNVGAAIIYPPDFSGEFPLYSYQAAMLVQIGGAFLIIGLTVTAMKAEEEKQILAAAGFTAMAISFGIGILIIFDITDFVTFKDYERYYRVYVSSNFLLIPAFVLIASYSKFKKWVKIATLIPVAPLLIVVTLFIIGERNYTILEGIANVGILFTSFNWLFWAYNMYVNYKQDVNN